MQILLLGSVLIAAAMLGGCETSRLVSEDLESWRAHGSGAATINENSELLLVEENNSRGVMLISPEVLPRDAIVRYQVKPLTADTVLVVVHSLSGLDGEDVLPPADYDGNIQWLLKATQNYFFAFHNAAHQRHPFLRKHDPPADPVLLVELEKNIVERGRWISVEAGRSGNRLWLALDGETVLEVIDPAPLDRGRAALRIRGTQTRAAECLIRDLSIETSR